MFINLFLMDFKMYLPLNTEWYRHWAAATAAVVDCAEGKVVDPKTKYILFIHPNVILFVLCEFNFDRILQVMRGRAVGSARVDENADVLCALQGGLVTSGHLRLSPLLFFLNTQLSD